jgi:Ca2+-binding RTX toxin-like protein
LNATGGDDIVDVRRLAAGVLTLTVDAATAPTCSPAALGTTLRGGVGDDVLIGGPGVDTLDGGPGNNIVIQD